MLHWCIIGWQGTRPAVPCLSAEGFWVFESNTQLVKDLTPQEFADLIAALMNLGTEKVAAK
jgi:hypothetical protein